MKQILFRIIVLFALIGLSASEAYACHGVALVGFNVSNNGSSVTVNANSDPATCGCGPYYMEVELACFSAANFSGNAPTCTATTWNVYPWYHSLLNVPNYTAAMGWPDNCVLEPYTPITIPFTQLCAGTTYVLRARERLCGNGSAGPWSSTYTFTTPGTPPSFILSASASPTSVCTNQPVTLTATLTGSGGCGSGLPTFTWNPGNLTGQTVTVNPTATTVYTVTVSGGYVTCYPVPPATVQVTVLPPPTAGTASVNPTTVCQGGCVTLTLTGYSGNIQWQSSPNGIIWNNIAGATTSPYLFCPVNAATYFHAVVSSPSGCGSATSNTVVVGIIPVPTLTINPANPQICLGQSVTLNVTGSSGYTWSAPSNPGFATGSSVTVTPTATTTYTVSTSASCPATQTVTVVVNPLPVISFSPSNPAICAGDSVTIDAGSNVNTYTWNPALGLTYLSASHDSVSASPPTTTTYNVTALSPAGCSSSGTVTLTVNPIPVLALSNDSVVICPNSSDTVTISGASNYTWSPLTGANILTGNGSQIEFTSAASGNYTVVGTSGSGCIDSTVVNVQVTNNIVVDAGLPDSICPGQSASLLGTGGTNYSWTSTPSSTIANGNTATPTVTPSVTTVYTVNVTNQFGCYGSDSVTVLVRNLPTPDAGVDTALCIGASINLNATGGNTYGWTGSNITSGAATATATIAPGTTGDYIVTVTDIYGCQNSDTVNVVVHQLPPANAGADQYICGNNCASLTASGGSVYAWSPTNGLSSPNTAATQACPQATTNYIVTVTDIYGCVNTDAVLVTVYPPLQVTASANTSICPGGTANISATASGGDGGPYTYSWSPASGLATPNASSSTATPTVTTTYTITVSDQCGSIVAVDSVTVTVFPQPQLSVTPSVTSGCAPVCVDFSGSSTTPESSCFYDFGDQSTSTTCDPSHCYSDPGSYTVTYTITDVNGCQNTITYPNMIVVHPNPVAGFSVTPQTTSILAPDVTITPNCTSCDTTIYMMGQDSIPVLNYVSTFTYTYTEPGTYNIMQIAVNQYGCADTAYDFVVIEPDWSFFAPNAFTPNGDGRNDVFMVYGDGIDNSTFEMWIFDRWGNLIFTSTDMTKGWDGTKNASELCQIDTYIWRVRFKDLNGNPHSFVGHANLIH